MTMHFPTVDLERQRLSLTSRIVGLVSEIWCFDAFVWCMWRAGYWDVSFEAAEPTDIRKLWLHRATPSGAAGILKWYDPELGIWVKIERNGWDRYWVNRAAPARVWYTSQLAAGTHRPPDAEVRPGDIWEHDVANDGHRSIYRITSPAQGSAPAIAAWWDEDGGHLDLAIVTQHTPRYTESDDVPSGEITLTAKTGDYHRNRITGRRYQFWTGEGWKDVVA